MSEKTLEWLRSYYALIDAMKVDECLDFFAPDARLRIAHHPPRVGRDAIGALLRAGLGNVKAIRHDLGDVWEDGGTLIFEVNVAYTLGDGRVVDIPGAAVCVVEGGRFKEQRIYADFAPLAGPPSRKGG